MKIRRSAYYELGLLDDESFKAFVAGGYLLRLWQSGVDNATCKIIDDGISISLMDKDQNDYELKTMNMIVSVGIYQLMQHILLQSRGRKFTISHYLG